MGDCSLRMTPKKQGAASSPDVIRRAAGAAQHKREHRDKQREVWSQDRTATPGTRAHHTLQHSKHKCFYEEEL